MILPNVSARTLKFENCQRKLKVPFVVYADFECMLINLPSDEYPNKTSRKNIFYGKHVPYSVGYYVKCSYDSTKSYYESYRGLDCKKWFVFKLKTIAFKVVEYLEDVKTMLPLAIEEDNFSTVKSCHICGSEFVLNDRVHDHCHLTGVYRGPAHNTCNLLCQDSRTIPVILHNFSGNDAHFIIKEIALLIPGDVKLLPLNKERYISFTKYFRDLDVIVYYTRRGES